MVKLALCSFVLSVAMIGFSVAQSVFPGGPRYDGTVKVVRLVGSSCPQSQTGSVFSASYRVKANANATIGEAMSIAIPAPAGSLFLLAGGDLTFAGANQAASGSFILDAWRGNLRNIVANLTFVPSALSATTPRFSFRGTLRNYLFSGCVATVQGSFTKRS
jgi:hypothetical protein